MADQDATICVELIHVVKDYRLRIANKDAEIEKLSKTIAGLTESRDTGIKGLRETIDNQHTYMDEIKSLLDHRTGLYNDCVETTNKLHEVIAHSNSTIANKDAEIYKLTKTIAGLNELREQQITTVQNLEAARVEQLRQIDDLKSQVVQLSTTIEHMSLLDNVIEKKHKSGDLARLEEENDELRLALSIWHKRAHPGCYGDRCLHS